MADIVLQSCFNSAKGAFKVEGAGSTRFKENFITAVNRAAKKMYRDANLEDAITAVDNIADTIEIDDAYEDVLNLGIIYNLIQLGQRPAKGLEVTARNAKEDFEEAIGMMYVQLTNDDQSDTSNDIIGLGSLT